jgi:pyruvate dehydrogenase E1 component beta subunit
LSQLTMVEAVNDALKIEMTLDRAVLVFGEDVGREGGVFRATVGLQEMFGCERCFDTPLAEGGIGAPEHHSESPEALFAHIPGLKVVIPSTPHDAKGLLIAAIRDPDPVVFLEPKRIYRSVRQDIPEPAYTLELGRARIVSPGEDLTLVSYGAQMKEAARAAAELEQEGISTELIDLRTIYPPDGETLLQSVRRTGRVLVVHEGPQSYGVAAEIISLILEGAFDYLEAPPSRLTGADTIVPLPRGERHYLIGSERIVAAARDLAAYRP